VTGIKLSSFFTGSLDAKKEETRKRRLREAVSLLEQNKQLGLK
jgi:hypothetical protein